MDEGLLGKPGLVDIIGVFSDLPVHGDQAFIIPAGSAAFPPEGTAEVKHVPDEAAPDKGPRSKGLAGIFVDQHLVFFAVIHLFRIVGMIADHSVAAIFADGDHASGISLVILVQPFGQPVHLSPVPAEIMVPALGIGDVMERMIPAGPEFVGDDRIPFRIDALYGLV